MRNTNSKEVRRAAEEDVRADVANLIEECDEATTDQPMRAAYSILHDEMEYQTTTRKGRHIVGHGLANMYRKSGRKYDTYTPAECPYWVWYLAEAVGRFECYTDNMRARLAEWLDETPDEASRYTSEQVEQLYYHLKAGAFERLYNKEV